MSFTRWFYFQKILYFFLLPTTLTDSCLLSTFSWFLFLSESVKLNTTMHNDAYEATANNLHVHVDRVMVGILEKASLFHRGWSSPACSWSWHHRHHYTCTCIYTLFMASRELVVIRGCLIATVHVYLQYWHTYCTYTVYNKTYGREGLWGTCHLKVQFLFPLQHCCF